MPIGKQSINRVAKKADTEEVKPIVAEVPAKEEKPATAKKSGSCKPRTKTVKLTPPEVDTKQEPTAPVVTEHVIANIDPEVVEKVVGKETPAPKDGKVKVTDPMPSYLL
jgi:hypothetical protein